MVSASDATLYTIETVNGLGIKVEAMPNWVGCVGSWDNVLKSIKIREKYESK